MAPRFCSICGSPILYSTIPHTRPMGYHLLILEAYSEFKNDCWLGYDRRFRQWTTIHPGTCWAAIEPTLWNLAFQGQARSTCCKHCFSLSHSCAECKLSLEPSPKQLQAQQQQVNLLPRPLRKPICYQWNKTPSPTCTYPNCRYNHICYICAVSPMARNMDHKALYCPHKYTENQQTLQPLHRLGNLQAFGTLDTHYGCRRRPDGL